jgi:cell division protein FtsL
MLTKEQKFDTIAWLIITVICTSIVTLVMVYENIGLKQKNYELQNKIKTQEYRIDSLEAIGDSLRVEMEIILDFAEESSKLREDEISFLGHTLDKHGIHPDYSEFGR